MNRLRSLWIESGGTYAFEGQSLSLETLFGHLQAGNRLVAGAVETFHSEIWGKIDLNRLNNFEDNFRGPEGQVELFLLLAVVTGRSDLCLADAKKRCGENAKNLFNERGWSVILTDWRSARELQTLVPWDDYQDEEGYRRCAIDFFGGNLNTTNRVVRSLLGRDRFLGLGWGKRQKGQAKEHPSVPRRIERTEQEWRDWLKAHPYGKSFSRDDDEKEEILVLHRRWKEAGGIYLYEGRDLTAEQLAQLLHNGKKIVDGPDFAVSSNLWGEARPLELNNLRDHFDTNAGQLHLCYLVAIVTKQPRFNINQFQKKLGEIPRKKGWTDIHFDWRFAQALVHLARADDYRGQEGLDRLAQEFLAGSRHKAPEARSLMYEKLYLSDRDLTPLSETHYRDWLQKNHFGQQEERMPLELRELRRLEREFKRLEDHTSRLAVRIGTLASDRLESVPGI